MKPLRSRYTPTARRRLATDLRQVCMRISRRARFENASELAPHQFSTLVQLEKGLSRPGDIARAECVSAPSMSRTLNKLMDLGFVRRDDDPDDGRAAVMQLTPEGREALKRVRRHRDAWMSGRIEHLTDDELDVLSQAREILARVVDR